MKGISSSNIMNMTSLNTINYVFKDFFGEELDLDSFENRVRLQRLILILKSYGAKFDYDFTWWKHGPYSTQLADDCYSVSSKKTAKPTRSELEIIKKIKRAQKMIRDSGNAELVASYLYLKSLMATEKQEEIKKELLTRKPYLNSHRIQTVLNKWKKAVEIGNIT
jgi:uncharacterized protein YwgA